MEAAMVSAAAGVMNAVLAKLTEMLGEKYKLVKEVRKDINFLASELRVMKEVLDIMADAEELDGFNKQWRDTVREMAYDIEDCIDLSVQRLSHTDDTKSGLVDKLKEKLRKLKIYHQIARDIQELKARVVEESKWRRRYMLDCLPSNSSNASVKVDPRMCALWVETERLVGIDGPRDKIIGLLIPKRLPQQVTTLSIIGCGGLGKTTLANQVHLKTRGEFECIAFVSVSQRPNIRDILMNICSQVGATPISDNVESLIDNLRKYLQHKR